MWVGKLALAFIARVNVDDSHFGRAICYCLLKLKTVLPVFQQLYLYSSTVQFKEHSVMMDMFYICYPIWQPYVATEHLNYHLCNWRSAFLILLNLSNCNLNLNSHMWLTATKLDSTALEKHLHMFTRIWIWKVLKKSIYRRLVK